MNGYPQPSAGWFRAKGRSGLLALAAAALLVGSPALGNPPDVRIVVDVSASMGQTDPDNRRSTAVGLLLRLLPEDGRAGVWTYGKFVNMLVKHDQSTALWKENAVILTGDLESVGARSNLLEAVDRATWDRGQTGTGPAHVVLLTDGRLNVSDDAGINQAQGRRLLAELAPELAAAGYRVHTLALSGRADATLLGQLAALTGGFHGRIDDPAALPEELVSVLGWVAAPARLPLAAQGTFEAAPGTRELTLLRLGARLEEPVALVDPLGNRFDRLTTRDRIRWHLGKDYELVSLPRPTAGTWRFEGPGGNVRLYAYGDLTAEYLDLPGTLFPGGLRSFELALTSAGEVVTDTAFLDLLTVSAYLHGETADLPLVVERGADGRFQVNLLGPEAQGEYLLETRIAGPTFDQTLSLPLLLKNPLTVEVRPAEDGFVLWSQVAAAELDHDSLRLSAMVKRPPGAARLVPLEKLPAGLWKLAVPGAKGLVEVSLDLQGNYLNDRSFDLRTQPIRVVLPVTGVQRVNLGLDGRPLLVAEPPAAPSGPVSGRPSARPPAATVATAVPPGPEPPAATLPLWLALAAGLINVALGVSIWWLVGDPRRREDVETMLQALRQHLGLAPESGEPDPAQEAPTPA